ncbi:ABC transporter substrate-binding protein [Kocuria sp. WN036]|uniref:ABC transporter substrate-binding protein n=1 Tax=Kocuria rosea subsp. polaris TaxID=136273 RepID=A0A0A6VUY4_KOCRO|nr:MULTISPECIES: ABC transporter substrate-binding protein [Kocuria]KHD97679.1 ABC transporter substrate-binding protein [Kocuria polaris]MCC5784066.1 ABC transporter substrate-binding protein [Kocuria sp. CCUG 69068]NVC24324.1 ABC transporter substrate-binding protein [Kocuria salina]PAU90481.1 ABC transporter substrate-binding protein [Kocuria sp. WN036]
MSAGGPSRRVLLRAGAGAAALTGLGWGAGSLYADSQQEARGAADPERPVRIGYLPITDASPLLVAHANGYYEDAAVPVADPVLFRSWSSLSEAFVAGKVDAIHLLMPMALYMRYGLRADVRITAWNHTNGSALTVRPDVAEIADLAGESVAIPAWWSVHNVVVQKLLRSAGLTPVMRENPSRARRTVALLPMAPSDMLPALNNGVIGGYVVADPFNAAAEARQVGHIHRFLGDVWRDHACCVTMMRGELLRNRPAHAAGFMDALVRAQAWARQNRPETAALLAAGYLPQPRPVIEQALTYSAAAHGDALHHPDWHGERLDFRPYPYASFTEELVRAMQDTVVDAPAGFLDGLDPALVHRELVDDTLVTRSIEKAGGLAAFGMTGTTRTEEISA